MCFMEVVLIECIYCGSEDNSHVIDGKIYVYIYIVVLKFRKMSEGLRRVSVRSVWNGEVETVAGRAMKVYKGNEHIASLILYLCLRWRWVVRLTPRSFYTSCQGVSGTHWMEVGWVLEFVRAFWIRENLLHLPESEHRIVRPVAM
jgi:hypothetical protein